MCIPGTPFFIVYLSRHLACVHVGLGVRYGCRKLQQQDRTIVLRSVRLG